MSFVVKFLWVSSIFISTIHISRNMISNPPAPCVGSLNMFNEDSEDFVIYFFELRAGKLSCYERETFSGSRIGDKSTLIGDELDLIRYVLEDPSKERLLLYQEDRVKYINLDENDEEINVEELDEGPQIQFVEPNQWDYNKWKEAFQQHLIFANAKLKRVNNAGVAPGLSMPATTPSVPPPQAATATATTTDTTVSTAPFIAGQSKHKYPDQTIEILRAQLRTAGKIPLEYIPLPELKEELARYFEMATNGQEFDEARLDFLLMCMDQNPEHQAEKEKEISRWREDILDYARECLDIMRGFIPPHILSCSLNQLEREGMSKDLAKRVMLKKCLWLVRFTSVDIGKLHIADLNGRYGVDAQGLDIVETAAIYAIAPEKFLNDDARGSKEQWRAKLENTLKTMYADLKAHKLPKNKQRVIQYKSQLPLYTNFESMRNNISRNASGDAEAAAANRASMRISVAKSMRIPANVVAASLAGGPPVSALEGPLKQMMRPASVAIKAQRPLSQAIPFPVGNFLAKVDEKLTPREEH